MKRRLPGANECDGDRVRNNPGGGWAFATRLARLTKAYPPPGLFLTCLLVASAACSSSGGGGGGGTAGVVVVNAPADGEVRRVLVSEGVRIKKGDAVAEIVVRTEPAAAPTPSGEDPVAAAGSPSGLMGFRQ